MYEVMVHTMFWFQEHVICHYISTGYTCNMTAFKKYIEIRKTWYYTRVERHLFSLNSIIYLRMAINIGRNMCNCGTCTVTPELYIYIVSLKLNELLYTQY